MLLNIEHSTEYHYDVAQRMIIQSHRLYPPDCNSQKVVSWDVRCDNGLFGHYFYDGAGDRLRTMNVNDSIDKVVITVSGQVSTMNTNGVIQLTRDIMPAGVYLRSSKQTQPTETLIKAAEESIATLANQQQIEALDKAHAMSHFINQTIKYLPESTTMASTANDAFMQGKGVCQDQTHCLITLARINGIPARYVTGYLFSDANGFSHDQSHAWAELFIENLGWVGFDATNNCCPDEHYVRLGSGFDAQEAALIRGISRGSGSESMTISVKISDSQQ